VADVPPTQRVQFTQMKDGTYDDYQLLHRFEAEYGAQLPDRILAALRRLDDGLAGYQVTRLEHSLQTAARAEADGADVDWIVAALVHDLGDELAPDNHSQYAASILRPYVREEVTWAVHMHGAFQLQYYGHHIGVDPDARAPWRDHRWYDSCDRFCERWDQASFDPSYPTPPLEHFEPMVREVFGRRPFDPAVAGERSPDGR
jgi:predicted HD phosphohydrolase